MLTACLLTVTQHALAATSVPEYRSPFFQEVPRIDWNRSKASVKLLDGRIAAHEIRGATRSKEAVTVEVVEPMPGDWEVLRESHLHEKIRAFTAFWKSG